MTIKKAAYHTTILAIAAGIYLFAFITQAYADTKPPVPARRINLEQIEEKIDNEKEQKKNLQEKLKDIEKELGNTKTNLVELTGTIQKQENSLKELEKRTATLEQEKQDITTRLEKEHGSIAGLVLALQRIRRMPPEAMIVRPDPPLKTAQSALLLQGMLPGIYKRAERLSADLNKLQAVTNELETDRNKLTAEIAELDKKYASMAGLIKKRENLYKKTQKDYKERSARVDRLAKEARSIQELVAKLEEEQKRKEQEQKERKRREETRTASIKSIPKKIIPYLPGGGGSRLPATGTIRTGFGDTDSFGAKSQGISIESRNGTVVVAPMGGKVRFAGFFKNHGNIVIIEHEDGYHSLVAGLSRIDTVVGQELDSGEPIGIMLSVNDRPPVLYYELRFEGKPVPPSKKIAGLS